MRLRPLIGLPALAALEVLVDPAARKLRSSRKGEEDLIVATVNDVPESSDDPIPFHNSKMAECLRLKQTVEEVRSALDGKTAHLDLNRRTELWKLLMKYRSCWDTGLQPGKASKMTGHIRVTGKPCRQKLRHMTDEMKLKLEGHLDQMLQDGIIRPSTSEWASCPVFAKKKGTTELRLCLDYRQVNTQIQGDAYPLPLLWNRVQQAAHHKFYTTIDLTTAFWNIPLDEESKPITALITHKGLYEFNILPFGLKVSPGIFQRAIDSTLGHLEHKGVLCYLDDIVVYSDDLDVHLKQIEEVISLCNDAGFTLNPRKCEWAQSEVTLLGYIVNNNGISPHPSKVAAIQMASAPKDKSELRSFLGTVGFFKNSYQTTPN